MKKIVPIILCITCLLSICAIGYAATSGFTVSYLGGVTDNSVTKLPADAVAESESFTVSNEIPQREGYEFVEWKLDYKKEVKYNYTVEYWLVDGNQLVTKVANDKPGTVAALGTEVTEEAIPMGSKLLLAPYRSSLRYQIRHGSETVTATITHDNYVIRIFYEPRPHGQ